jgi:release factor glutamine methyltransferase
MNNKHLTFLDIIKLSVEYLEKRGVPNAKCDTEWIVSNITQKKRVELYLNYENMVAENHVHEIRKNIIERGKRIPLQHILGKVNFAGSELLCDQRALIPRPETELLTELVTDELGSSFKGKILDLGTGTGGIIITLCKNFPHAIGLGVDISKDALSLACENLAKNKIKNLEIKTFNWNEDEFNEKFDAIIANPPYLSEREWESAEPEVKIFDPKIALVAKDDGIADIKKIIKISENNLVKNGLFALEIGVNQEKKIADMMSVCFYKINIIKDYCRKNRYIIARKK